MVDLRFKRPASKVRGGQGRGGEGKGGQDGKGGGEREADIPVHPFPPLRALVCIKLLNHQQSCVMFTIHWNAVCCCADHL